MLSFRRWLDRVTDRRPVVRITRSSYRKRRRPWRLLLLLLALVLLIGALLIWSQSEQAPSGRVVEISTGQSGEHQLNGRTVSIETMEAELLAMRAGVEPLFAAIAGAGSEPPPVMPSPEVEALLARLKISWMAQDGLPSEAAQPPAP